MPFFWAHPRPASQVVVAPLRAPYRSVLRTAAYPSTSSGTTAARFGQLALGVRAQTDMSHQRSNCH